MSDNAQAVNKIAMKLIYCLLPDDGTDQRLLVELRRRFDLVGAGSATCRGIAALTDVKTLHNKLPEPELVKQLYLTCPEDKADEVFEYLFWAAELDRPHRGMIWQQHLPVSTAYQLDPEIPDEVETS